MPSRLFYVGININVLLNIGGLSVFLNKDFNEILIIFFLRGESWKIG